MPDLQGRADACLRLKADAGQEFDWRVQQPVDQQEQVPGRLCIGGAAEAASGRVGLPICINRHVLDAQRLCGITGLGATTRRILRLRDMLGRSIK